MFHESCTVFWFILSSCWFYILPNIESAAQPHPTFKRYTIAEGLSHNYVRNILQDSAGFMWMATEDGLNKFDGYTFQKYLHTSGDHSSLATHVVTALEEDPYYNVWVGTWSSGIYVYDRKHDSFQRIAQTDGSSRRNLNFVYDLHRDAKGRMWAGTGGGLARIDADDYSLRHFKPAPSDTESLNNYHVVSISEGPAGKLWLGTRSGLACFDPEQETFRYYIHQPGDPRSLSHNNIYEVFYDSQDRLWVGTWDGGLNLMKNEQDGFIRFQYNPDDPASLSNDQIWTIAEDKEGNIWVGTDDGLCLFNEAENSFFVYKNDPFDVKSVSANSVKSLQVDRQNRLWVGTYSGGVNLYDSRSNQIQHYYQKQSQQTLSDNNVSAIVELDQTRVLIGTDGGGLNLFDRVDGQFTSFLHDPDNPRGIASNKIKGILKDRQGRIWIGFWDGGLDYFDPAAQTFTHFRKDAPETEGWLTSDNVTCLAEDRDGLLWLGTFGGGLHSFDPEQKKFITYAGSGTDETLSDKNIWAVLADQENNIWIGTSNGRVHVLDREQNRFVHVLPQRSEKQAFIVQVLFEDSQGRIWAGLEGGGLRLINRDGLPFTTYTYADGLSSNTINAIEESEDGQLWLSTNNGLTRFDPATGRCQSYAVSDGLQGHYFNRQASERLGSGELVFGGTNGVNIFHPDSLRDIRLDMPIVFTNFEIFNQPVAIGEENSPLDVHINFEKEITLSHKQSVFSLTYAGINFRAPEQVRYRYRLLGFVDDTWQEAGSERKVTYTNLQPARYVFEVSGSINDRTTPPRALTIIVTPPWWSTWWFRIAAGLCLASLLYAAYGLRLRSIRRHNQKLEKEVAERTMKLRKANEELQKKNLLIQDQNEEIQMQAEELAKSNEEIRTINQGLEDVVTLRTTHLKKSNEELDNFVYRVSHDIRAPLSSVLGLLELMGIDQDPEQLHTYREMAAKSINKLDSFVREILDYSRNSRLQLQLTEINFSELLDNILEDLQYMKNAQRLRIKREIKDGTPYYSDPMRLRIIFRNLLSNAIKYQNPYAPDPFIKVRITVSVSEVVIMVEDNGIGIREEQAKRVFEMFYRGDEYASGSGIGLYIVKETVDKLGGTISLSSQVEVGTTFTVKLPNHAAGVQ